VVVSPKLLQQFGLSGTSQSLPPLPWPQQMPMLEGMADRFPGVKIVMDHLGKLDLVWGKYSCGPAVVFV